jgi:ribosomal protein S18 acetylase RimI-like enzyme
VDDDPRLAIRSLRALADAASRDGDDAAAASHYAEAVAVARAGGDDRLLAHTVRHEGDVLRRAGRLDEARARYDEALSLYRSLEEPAVLELANALRPMALLLDAVGDPGAAAVWAEARDLYARAGVAEGVDEADAALGRRDAAAEPAARDAVTMREAVAADLPTLIALLADDPLGSQREEPAPGALSAYRTAFDAITGSPDHQLLVAAAAGRPVAVLQLSFLPHLTYTGGWRAQIEGVRVAADWRSRGLGRRLLEEAIDRARERGCHLVQLTTDVRRPAARAFYERLGFRATHHGMKLHFDRGAPVERADSGPGDRES